MSATNFALYGGACDHCGRAIERQMTWPTGTSPQPGLRVRCQECRRVSYLLPKDDDGDSLSHQQETPFVTSNPDCAFRRGDGQ